MEAETVAQAVQESAHGDFGGGVFAPDAAHVPGAAGFGEAVAHAAEFNAKARGSKGAKEKDEWIIGYAQTCSHSPNGGSSRRVQPPRRTVKLTKTEALKAIRKSKLTFSRSWQTIRQETREL